MSDMAAPISSSHPPDLGTPRRAVLLVNTKSRRGHQFYEAAKEKLTELGVQLEAAYSFKNIGELLGEAQEAVRREAPIVIAGGGDGTFSALANTFVGRGTVLGVLPLGTGNAFARDLQIPVDVAQACRVVAKGVPTSVDLGRLGDRHFVNVATYGLTTKIAGNLTVDSKRRYGRFVYAIAIFKALRHIKPFTVRIHTENGDDEFETLQLVIGNGRYHAGPFPLSPDASIREGKLTVYALKSVSRRSFLKLAFRLPSGTHGALPDVHSEETVGGTLQLFPPMAATVDGEICDYGPETTFAVAPRALRVLVPPASTAR